MKSKQFILTLILISLPFCISGQYKKMLDVLEDTENEANQGKFALRFFDAITGDPVNDATVSIQDLGDFTSDLSGKVLFDIQKDGKYSFKFIKKDYITAIYQFEVVAGTIFFNRFSVCPKTELGALRIVLDWDKSPADLDLHLVKEGSYHISYHNSISSGDGSAQLDRDDRDGYGPETITINKTDNTANYTCFVHDYSNRSSTNSVHLSRSKAVVRVYNNNELTDTFYVPSNRKGNKWSVFQIHLGQIVGEMRLSNEN